MSLNTHRCTAGFIVVALLSVAAAGLGSQDEASLAVPNYSLVAAYSPTLKAPFCAGRSVSCSSGKLLTSRPGCRGTEQEPNPPNTLDDCPDGQEGLYTIDETIESITVSSLDGAMMTAGTPVKVAVAAICNSADDKVALYSSSAALAGQAVEWQQVAVKRCSSDEGELQSTQVTVFNFTHTLGLGVRQAYRAQMVLTKAKDLKPCMPGPYNDHDDLVFDVQDRTATFTDKYTAPICEGPFTACNSGPLLLGRGKVSDGAERNAPNTLDGCADGDSGAYRREPSIEYVNLRALSGKALAAEGGLVVEVKAYCQRPSNTILVYHAASAAKPDWRLVAAQVCTSTQDVVTYEFPFKLPAGDKVQAVRMIMDTTGATSSSCLTGPTNDVDDLVFSLP